MFNDSQERLRKSRLFDGPRLGSNRSRTSEHERHVQFEIKKKDRATEIFLTVQLSVQLKNKLQSIKQERQTNLSNSPPARGLGSPAGKSKSKLHQYANQSISKDELRRVNTKTFEEPLALQRRHTGVIKTINVMKSSEAEAHSRFRFQRNSPLRQQRTMTLAKSYVDHHLSWLQGRSSEMNPTFPESRQCYFSNQRLPKIKSKMRTSTSKLESLEPSSNLRN